MVNNVSTPEHTVLDLFCGAGGFSEGFKQQGFKIIMGIDNWAPAKLELSSLFIPCSVKRGLFVKPKAAVSKLLESCRLKDVTGEKIEEKKDD